MADTIKTAPSGYTYAVGGGWASGGKGQYIIPASKTSEPSVILSGISGGLIRFVGVAAGAGALTAESSAGGAAMNGEDFFSTDFTDESMFFEPTVPDYIPEDIPSVETPIDESFSGEFGGGDLIIPDEPIDQGFYDTGEPYNAVADTQIDTPIQNTAAAGSAGDITQPSETNYSGASLLKNLLGIGQSSLSLASQAKGIGALVSGASNKTSTASGQLINSAGKPKTGIVNSKTVTTAAGGKASLAAKSEGLTGGGAAGISPVILIAAGAAILFFVVKR